MENDFSSTHCKLSFFLFRPFCFKDLISTTLVIGRVWGGVDTRERENSCHTRISAHREEPWCLGSGCREVDRCPASVLSHSDKGWERWRNLDGSNHRAAGNLQGLPDGKRALLSLRCLESPSSALVGRAFQGSVAEAQLQQKDGRTEGGER